MPGKQAKYSRILDVLRGRARVLRFGFLKRIHRRGERGLWKFNRSSVARGVAVGLFFGVLVPVAQIVFALFCAVALRANILATVLSTMVTNPVTLPFVYLYAYRMGTFLTVRGRGLEDDVAVSEAAAGQALDVTGWASILWDWASSIALPFMLGLVLLAIAAALLGYTLVHAAFGVRVAWQRFRRRSPDR